MSDIRDEIAWASFRATFHPDEDEELVRQKCKEWGDGEFSKHLVVADRILAIPRIKEALEHPEGCDGG